MLEIETRDLLRLQKQVDGLVQTNSEKEKVIKILKDLKDNLKHQNVSVAEEGLLIEVELNDDEIHEKAVVDEERCEAEDIKKATIEYAQKCLTHVEKLEVEIRKIKKNTPDLGTSLMTRCKQYCERLDGIEVNEELCEEVLESVYNLREYLRYADRKPEKERNLRSISACKRPHQIPKNNCCKSCFQMS